MTNLSEKNQNLIILSLILICISLYLELKDSFIIENYEIKYEHINTKDMAKANVTSKTKSTNILSNLLQNKSLKEVEMVKVVENELPEKKDSASASATPKRIWYLPTEVGTITQYPSYYHAAYDITSYRGSAETIFPVANGKISGIYTDPAGALMVTVLHDVEGKKYTSMYGHLAYYADGLYVGKDVTINDALGQMGTTGNSTGIHLHITLLDCALFDPNDSNCRDLNGWYNYDKLRITQDFYGLGVVVHVPDSWNSR